MFRGFHFFTTPKYKSQEFQTNISGGFVYWFQSTCPGHALLKQQLVRWWSWLHFVQATPSTTYTTLHGAITQSKHVPTCSRLLMTSKPAAAAADFVACRCASVACAGTVITQPNWQRWVDFQIWWRLEWRSVSELSVFSVETLSSAPVQNRAPAFLHLQGSPLPPGKKPAFLGTDQGFHWNCKATQCHTHEDVTTPKMRSRKSLEPVPLQFYSHQNDFVNVTTSWMRWTTQV